MYTLQKGLGALCLAVPLCSQGVPEQRPKVRAGFIVADPSPKQAVSPDAVVPLGHRAAVTAILFSPDGETLVSSGEDGRVLLWNAREGTIRRHMHADNGPVRSVALSRDGRGLAAGSEDGTIRLFDLQTGELLRTMASGEADPITNMAFDADGKRLVSGTARSGMVRLWDIEKGEQVRAVASGIFGLTAVFFNQDGNPAAASLEGDMELRGTLRIYDAADGELRESRDGILRAASPGGELLAVESTAGVRLLRTGVGDVGPPLAGSAAIVAFSPEGEWVAYADRENSVFRVRAVAGDRSVEPIPGFDWSKEFLALSPDGGMLASAGRVSTIRVWETATGRALNELGAGGGLWFSRRMGPSW